MPSRPATDVPSRSPAGPVIVKLSPGDARSVGARGAVGLPSTAWTPPAPLPAPGAPMSTSGSVSPLVSRRLATAVAGGRSATPARRSGPFARRRAEDAHDAAPEIVEAALALRRARRPEDHVRDARGAPAGHGAGRAD